MPDEVKQIIPADWMWLVEIAIGVILIFALSLIFNKLLKSIDRRHRQKGKEWARNIKKISHLPIQIAIWGFGITYIVDVLVTHAGLDAISRFVHPIKPAFIVGCFGWMALRWNHYAFIRLAKKSEKLGVAPSVIYALSKLSSFVLLILTLLIIFQVVGIGIGPLLAFGGIGVAGIAFAAKDMMANFFGGAMLHFTRIFSIGDEVVIPSKDNFNGEVKEIGWYTTKIEDYYRRPVYFPNALFSQVHVINESRRTHRRIKETVTIRYEDMPKLEKIIEELREKIGGHPDVDDSQSFSITFNKLGDFGLDIYAYILVYRMGYIKFMRVRHELLMIYQEVVGKHGAEFAFPTTEVHLKQPVK